MKDLCTPMIVCGDIRTTTGNNLHLIRDLSGLDPWSCRSGQVKKVLGDRLGEVPAQDMWRLGYLGKLLEQRGKGGPPPDVGHHAAH